MTRDYTLTEILGPKRIQELADEATKILLYGVPVAKMSPKERLAFLGWMNEHGWPWGRSPLIDFLPATEGE